MATLSKIIVSGFGCSGSSVVVDWAREFDGCHVFPDEFDLFRHPDGVQDLRDALTRRISLRRCFIAMERFSRLVAVMSRPATAQFGRDYEKKAFSGFESLMQDFLDDLTAITYPASKTATWIALHGELSVFGNFTDEASLSTNDRAKISKLNRRANSRSKAKARLAKALLRFHGQPRRTTLSEMHQPKVLDEKEFDALARQYFDKMAKCIGPRSKSHLVLDQAIGASGMPDGLNLMSDCKAVVVHRDPRDVYMSGLKAGRDWVPTASPEEFAQWLSVAMPPIQLDDPRVALVGFEKLVQEPERAFGFLADFLGLDMSQRKDMGRFFDPQESSANVGRWQTHPDQELISKVALKCQPIYDAVRKRETL